MCFQSARRCSGNFRKCQVMGEDAGCWFCREQSLGAVLPLFTRGRLQRKCLPCFCRCHSQSTVQGIFGILPWPGVQTFLLQAGIRSWWLVSSHPHCTGLPQFLSAVKTQAPGCGERHASFWPLSCYISPHCGWHDFYCRKNPFLSFRAHHRLADILY